MRRIDSLLLLKNARRGQRGNPSVREPSAQDEGDSELIVDWPASAHLRSISQNQETRTKRSVSFATAKDLKFIRSLHEMSPEEISATWYTPQDQAEMRDYNKQLVRVMRRSSSEMEFYNKTGESSRGLEHLKSAAILETLRQNQDGVVDAVLLAQERQQRTGFHEVDAVASASFKVSKWARDRAASTGVSDAAAIVAQKLDSFPDSCSKHILTRPISPSTACATDEKRTKRKSAALRQALELTLMESTTTPRTMEGETNLTGDFSSFAAAQK